ncbi:MAG TPA: nucleotidyltransferase family protein [Candidatus Acidoferrales bacterium]|nr:nucleotidyltransferase family protein [Candidatus Acidoferrales bacterium]
MTLSTDLIPSAEKQLLVYCARKLIDAPIIAEIRQFLCSPIDWDILLLEATNHSVTPLLCRQLSLVASDLLDPARLQLLTEVSRGFAMRNLVLCAELVTITNRFQSEGLQVIPYKGPVLAVQAYADEALREFVDLDIILRQRDMAKANEIMIGLGYRPKLPEILSRNAPASLAPGEYEYRDDSRHIMVELHTERTLRHFPVPADIEDLATRLVAIPVGGHDLRTFSPEDTFLLLCIHGSKHFWEQLSWIADLAAFVQAYPRLDWDQVFHRAQSMRATRILDVSLALTFRFFNLPFDDFKIRVRSDPLADSIASKIQHRLLARSPGERGAMARFHLRRQMLKGPIEGWHYSLRLATQPADDDWSLIPLPPRLAPLYAALRPLRLLRKYGVSGTAWPRGSD